MAVSVKLHKGVSGGGQTNDTFYAMYKMFEAATDYHTIVKTSKENPVWSSQADVDVGDYFVVQPKHLDSPEPGTQWTLVVAFGNDATILNIDKPLPSGYYTYAKMYWGPDLNGWWDGTGFVSGVKVSPWVVFAGHFANPTYVYFHVWEVPGAIAWAVFNASDNSCMAVNFLGRFTPINPPTGLEPVLLISGDAGYWSGGLAGYRPWGSNGSGYYACVPNFNSSDWETVFLQNTNNPAELERVQNTYYDNGGVGKPMARPIPIYLAGGTQIVGWLPALEYNTVYQGLFDTRYLSDSASDATGDRVTFAGVSFYWE